MKFHVPSFLLGVGVTAAAVASRARLRPVAVEVTALGLHLGRQARSIAERRREEVEDFWAEVEERVRGRARAGEAGERGGEPRAPLGGNGAARAQG
jgi:hypothetical protein